MAAFVTVATYLNSFEAEIAKSRLAESNIPAFIRGGQSVRHLGGGRSIELQVNAADADAARSLLAMDLSGYDEELTALEAEAAADQAESESPDRRDHCPRCGSDNIFVEKHSMSRLFFSAFFIFVPLLFLKQKHECAICGMKW